MPNLEPNSAHLAAVAWVSVFALIWCFLLGVVELAFGSGIALSFFFLAGWLGSSTARADKKESDEQKGN